MRAFLFKRIKCTSFFISSKGNKKTVIINMHLAGIRE
jgi:hypothetical protein